MDNDADSDKPGIVVTTPRLGLTGDHILCPLPAGVFDYVSLGPVVDTTSGETRLRDRNLKKAAREQIGEVKIEGSGVVTRSGRKGDDRRP